MIYTCRSCLGHSLTYILDLGLTPLANALLDKTQLDQLEPKYPLIFMICNDCTLVQITETVDPNILFSNYLYFSSFSDTMLKHSKLLVNNIIKKQKLTEKSKVVEIASNDGYLLQFYKQHNIEVLGIEPAANVAKIAVEHNIPTIVEFFNRPLADQLAWKGKIDVIHAHNVLGHVADLNSVVAGMAVLLAPDGVIIIEVPYVKNLIDQCQFDTIYHEHLCYFSLTSLSNLFNRHNLIINDVENVPIHGGSLRLYIKLTGNLNDKVITLLDAESSGINHIKYYLDFITRINILKRTLYNMIISLKKLGKRIAAYTASAKGNMLMNYFDIGTDLIDYTVDITPYKQGKYTPGMHLPIYHPSHIIEDMPDYVLLLAWNFADEILNREKEYRKRGGKFIIPIPEIKVV